MSFWKSLTTWTATLAVAVLVYVGLVRVAQGQALAFIPLVASAPGLVSGLLPFTAFAAARRFGGRGMERALWGHVLGAAALSYVLVAGIHPHVQHRMDNDEPFAVEGYGELAAPTAFELIARKRYIVEHPPDEYSLDVGQPLAMPPNWLDFLVHSPIAIALFTIINGCLGAVLGRRYYGTRSASRRLWLLGILAGALFMLPAMAAGDYVRASLGNSGVGAAWIPLVLPLIALLVCMRLVPCPPGEDDEHGEGATGRKS